MEEINTNGKISKYPIFKTVKNYFDDINHENHRYKSWEHCFNAFQQHKDTDYLSLQLAFYLASWGMYRGSTGLLWKDYKIHEGAVNILLDKEYDTIRCNSGYEINESKIEKINDVKNKLCDHYGKVEYKTPKKKGKVTPTDTLITKILLGTLGCVPAYDRIFKDGLKIFNLKQKFEPGSLNELFDFVNVKDNLRSFKSIQEYINHRGCPYPIMKIVDMYFWEVGRQNPSNKISEYEI